MAGISLDLTSNVKDFLRGTDDVEKALDEVGDSLDDLARDAKPAASKMGDALAREVKDGGRDAEQSLERVEKSFKELATAAKRETKDAGDAAKKNLGKGSPATDAVGEFKDEAMSNFSEVASSFSGDMADMADGVQGLTGGLATALTPGVGIPVAILGAAAGAFLASWQENAEKTEERIGEMYDDMIESGLNYISKEEINAQIAATLRDPASYEEARKAAELLGMTTGEIAAAWASNGDARDEYIARAGAANEEAAGTFDDLAEYASRKLIEKMADIEAAQDKATERVNAYRDAVEASTASTEDQATKTHTNLGTTATKVQEVTDKLNAMKSPALSVGIDTSAAEAGLEALRRTIADNPLVVRVATKFDRVGTDAP